MKGKNHVIDLGKEMFSRHIFIIQYFHTLSVTAALKSKSIGILLCHKIELRGWTVSYVTGKIMSKSYSKEYLILEDV